ALLGAQARTPAAETGEWAVALPFEFVEALKTLLDTERDRTVDEFGPEAENASSEDRVSREWSWKEYVTLLSAAEAGGTLVWLAHHFRQDVVEEPTPAGPEAILPLFNG